MDILACHIRKSILFSKSDFQNDTITVRCNGSIYSLCLFFSSDCPETKNQMSAEVFLCCLNLKRETTSKRFSWHLVFSIWFLVTGWSNEKNRYFHSWYNSNLKYVVLHILFYRHVTYTAIYNLHTYFDVHYVTSCSFPFYTIMLCTFFHSFFVVDI